MTCQDYVEADDGSLELDVVVPESGRVHVGAGLAIAHGSIARLIVDGDELAAEYRAIPGQGWCEVAPEAVVHRAPGATVHCVLEVEGEMTSADGFDRPWLAASTLPLFGKRPTMFAGGHPETGE